MAAPIRKEKGKELESREFSSPTTRGDSGNANRGMGQTRYIGQVGERRNFSRDVKHEIRKLCFPPWVSCRVLLLALVGVSHGMEQEKPGGGGRWQLCLDLSKGSLCSRPVKKGESNREKKKHTVAYRKGEKKSWKLTRISKKISPQKPSGTGRESKGRVRESWGCRKREERNLGSTSTKGGMLISEHLAYKQGVWPEGPSRLMTIQGSLDSNDKVGRGRLMKSLRGFTLRSGQRSNTIDGVSLATQYGMIFRNEGNTATIK